MTEWASAELRVELESLKPKRQNQFSRFSEHKRFSSVRILLSLGTYNQIGEEIFRCSYTGHFENFFLESLHGRVRSAASVFRSEFVYSVTMEFSRVITIWLWRKNRMRAKRIVSRAQRIE